MADGVVEHAEVWPQWAMADLHALAIFLLHAC
jgi:hypothetical protein